MTDIVERLRRRHEQAAENYGELDSTLWSEAADEIERLRADLANECERRDEIIASETHLRKEADAEVQVLMAEVERLRYRSERGWP